MDTILVTGKDGFFASRFIECYKNKYNIIGLSHNELDITDEKKTIETILKYSPNYLVHTAALSDTGFCERNPDMSFEINVKGSSNVAKGCSKTKTKLIYLSSDQVYNGNVAPGPYNEECIAIPNTVYGNHKMQAENDILGVVPDAIILRFTWLFSLPEKHKKINSNIIWNIVKSALKNQPIKFSPNEYRGITYVYDVVKNFDKILKLPYGIYNVGSENNLSTYDVAKVVLEKMGLKDRIEEILIKDVERYKTLNKDLRISNSKLKNKGICFTDTEEAVCKCVEDFLFQV